MTDEQKAAIIEAAAKKWVEISDSYMLAWDDLCDDGREYYRRRAKRWAEAFGLFDGEKMGRNE